MKGAVCQDLTLMGAQRVERVNRSVRLGKLRVEADSVQTATRPRRATCRAY